MKISQSEPNVANRIAMRVTQRFPDLARNPIDDVWFTGSNIWTCLYEYTGPSEYAMETRDWDIFTIGELAAIRLVTGMSWNLLPAFPTKRKRDGIRDPIITPGNLPSLSKRYDPDGNPYSEGYCYITDQGDVDVWVAGSGSALAEIRDYPDTSHAHCRAAFSLTDGLIVLPNEAAR